MTTVESIARPRRNRERRRAPTDSISKESPAITGLVEFFFFHPTSPTKIYTLSLHDALPIYLHGGDRLFWHLPATNFRGRKLDRKSTRLNSSHLGISYAVFCLKKKT